MICDECETVVHCTKNGCIPKVPLQGKSVIETTPEDEEFNRIERESDMRLKAVSAALEDHANHLQALKAMARLYIPDAMTKDEGESPEYMSGWNDCRAEMLRGRT